MSKKTQPAPSTEPAGATASAPPASDTPEKPKGKAKSETVLVRMPAVENDQRRCGPRVVAVAAENLAEHIARGGVVVEE